MIQETEVQRSAQPILIDRELEKSGLAKGRDIGRDKDCKTT
jgi:hypothetical protein